MSFSTGSPDPGIKPMSFVSRTLADRFFTTEPRGKPPAWLQLYKAFHRYYLQSLGVVLPGPRAKKLNILGTEVPTKVFKVQASSYTDGKNKAQRK